MPEPVAPPLPDPAAPPRLAVIEDLRAVAALGVVACHAGARVAPALPPGPALWLPLGQAGVDLFFVISGLVVWRLARRGDASPGAFLWRRLCRVAPPYWVATLAFIGLSLAAGLDWAGLRPGHVAASLAFWPMEHPAHPGRVWPVLVPGWTLQFEVLFYALAAAALALPPRHRLAGLCAALAALAGAGLILDRGSAWAAGLTSPLLLEFLGGCLLAEALARRPRGPAGPILALAAGLALFFLLGPGADPDDPWQRLARFGGPALLVTFGLAGLEPWRPRAGALSRLGAASYAIYLSHLFVLLPMEVAWHRAPALHGPAGATGFVALALPLCIAAGLAFETWVERPLRRALAAPGGGLRHATR